MVPRNPASCLDRVQQQTVLVVDEQLSRLILVARKAVLLLVTYQVMGPSSLGTLDSILAVHLDGAHAFA